MTVTANTTRNDYTAGSAQSVYNYTFQLNEAADVDVYLDGVKQTLNTHYTVQNVGNASGGTITFTLVDANNNPIHPTQGAVINIVMAMDLDRDTNYQPSGAFLAADVNNDFDRLWLATNQQQTAINRSLRLQDDDVTTSSMELPLKDARKGKLLAFNATTGDPEATSNNQSNWDSAYNDIITSASFSNGNYTLTQRDGGTITTSLDGRYLKLSGGTVTGTTNFTEGLFVDQNEVIGFNGAQLVIGTSGTESFIIEGGTGDLSIDAANLNLRASPAVNYITATYQGAVSLYHDNSVKLATTNTGISVTGTLSATGYNDTNWNTAYGWGDHSTAGYLTSYTETDPVFSAHAASGVTATKISNWDTAYNNHITGVSYSGSTLTLTQQDGGTITTTINTSGGGGGGGETLAQTLAIGNTTGGNDISFGDNDRAKFGASNDLQIYHDSSNNQSYIAEGGLADLLITTNGAGIKLQKNTGENMIKALTDGAVTLYYDNQDKLATTSTGIDVTGGITASGHVGIGTTSPDMVGSTRTLHINGNSGGGGIRLSQGSVNDGSISYTYPGGISFSTLDRTRLRINANLGDVSFYEDSGTTPKLYWDASAEQFIAQDGAFFKVTETDSSTVAAQLKSDSDEGLLQLYHNGAEKVRVRTNADSYFNGGNVGINTSSPTAKLSIHEAVNTPAIEVVPTTDNTNADSASIRLWGTRFGTANRYSEIRNVTDGSTANNELAFDTNGTERLRIDSSGNVGIGTTSIVDSKLHLKTTSSTNLRIEGGDPNSKNIVFVKNTGGTQQAKITAVGENLYFTTGTTHERMRIDSSGNVGIGDTNPARKLTVQGGSGDNLPVRVVGGSGTTKSHMEFQDASTTADYKVTLGSVGDGMSFQAGGSERMLIDSSGKVGIGTSSPSTPLHVKSTSGNCRILAETTGTTDSSQASIQLKTPTDNWQLVMKPVDSALQFYDGGAAAERMRIDSSGNLLVGKTASNNGSTAGSEVQADGQIFVTKDSDASLYLNRLTNDGSLAIFKKNGTSVGSIGTYSTDLTIGTTDIGVRFDDNASAYIPWNVSTNASTDATIDLGASSVRYKDLHLSGGIKGSTLTFSGNGSSEHARIDSSGNVLIGKTASDSGATVGIELLASDKVIITDAASEPLILNRTSTDGNIQVFKNDGVTVGAIGVSSGEFYIAHDGTTDTGLRFRGNGTIIPVNSNGNGTNGTQDLGDTLYNFKDLHLSGVVRAGDGGSLGPSYTFGDDTDTGMFSPSNDTIAFAEGGVERMRLNTSGQLIVGATSGGSFGAKIRANGLIEGQGVKATGNSSAFYQAGNYGGASISVYGYTNSTTSTMKMLSFRNSSGTEKGSISVLNATTSYNTSSDERLKENIQDAGDAGSKIDAIRIRQFDWIEGGEHQDYGVIAQELQSVAPEAVTEGYNEEDMWSVDYSKLVPTLIKEIQSLRNRVAELENN